MKLSKKSSKKAKIAGKSLALIATTYMAGSLGCSHAILGMTKEHKSVTNVCCGIAACVLAAWAVERIGRDIVDDIAEVQLDRAETEDIYESR